MAGAGSTNRPRGAGPVRLEDLLRTAREAAGLSIRRLAERGDRRRQARGQFGVRGQILQRGLNSIERRAQALCLRRAFWRIGSGVRRLHGEIIAQTPIPGNQPCIRALDGRGPKV